MVRLTHGDHVGQVYTRTTTIHRHFRERQIQSLESLNHCLLLLVVCLDIHQMGKVD